MTNATIAENATELANLIPDGASLALFKDNAVPLALGRALIARKARDLHVVTVPTGALLPDMLIGAGCVATIETAGISLGEFGLAPRFIEAVKSGSVRVLDATCPAVYAGLQAAEKGLPFMPLRGLIGSDILANRSDFKVIDNPFAAHDRIVALPAIRPDFALFHAAMADHSGNVYIGRQAELKIMAHAAATSLVTVERIVDYNLLEDERLAPGCLHGLYVGAVAAVPDGARPLALPGHYAQDNAAIKRYATMARTAAGFAEWLAEDATGSRHAAA